MTPDGIALALIDIPAALLVYAYAVYPALLWLGSRFRAQTPAFGDPPDWPSICILVPAYNEERIIGGTIDSLLALDYPADRRRIIVMSDASADRTDRIVQSYAGRGVELMRQEERRGKTAAENAALQLVREDIVVNTDASVRIRPDAIKPLVRSFQDPSIGVASGRDTSVGDEQRERNRGERGYVDYEMRVRALETQLGTLIGASGCFYAIRREITDHSFPEELSRDFAAPLRARLLGFRTVSVDEAVCAVPRARGLRAEYLRKVRTMARGLETLWYMRALLNPWRYGRFAVMLWSHKVARWLAFLALPLGVAGLALLALHHTWAAGLFLATIAGAAIGVLALRWPADRPIPRLVMFAGFALVSCAAGFAAWMRALRQKHYPTWEPTRRPA